MHLYLTGRSHLNSSYVNNDGQVLYKVETPFKFVGLVSTITSALPGDIPVSSPSRINDPPPYDQIGDNNVKGDVEYDEIPDDDVDGKHIDHEPAKEVIELPDRFAHLAEIKFNRITSSLMRYRGEEYETSSFFTKKELGWHGRYAFLYRLGTSL
jgi:hypothetical protein